MIKATIEYNYVVDGQLVYITLIENEVTILRDIELPTTIRSRITGYYAHEKQMYKVLYDLNKNSKERVSLVRYDYVKNKKGVN